MTNTTQTTYRANISNRFGRYSVALWVEGSDRPGLNDLRAKTDEDAIAELRSMAAIYGWNVSSAYLVHQSWSRVF